MAPSLVVDDRTIASSAGSVEARDGTAGRRFGVRASAQPSDVDADLCNTWRQPAFLDLIRSCLHRHRGCGVVADPL
jgi:hypothetical protein